MSGERQQFSVLRINPEIVKNIHKQVTRNSAGFVTGTQDVEERFQIGIATDGSRFEGQLTEFHFKLSAPDSVDIGDIFSAYTVPNSTWLFDIFFETGRSAVVPERRDPKLPNTQPIEIPSANPAPGEVPLWSFGSAVDGREAGIGLHYLYGFCLHLKARVAQLEAQVAQKGKAA